MEEVTGIPTGNNETGHDGLICLDKWNDTYPGRLVFRTIGRGYDDQVTGVIDEARNSSLFDKVKVLITSQRFEVCGLISEDRRTSIVRFVVGKNIQHAVNLNIPNPSMEIVYLGGE